MDLGRNHQYFGIRYQGGLYQSQKKKMFCVPYPSGNILQLATVGLWVSVSHDQRLFQLCAMTMGHSERSVLPENTICMSIPPAVGSSVEFISFRAIAVLSRPPAPYT